MTDTPTTDPAGALLARVERGLQQQLERIARGDIDGLETLLAECDSLLAQLPPSGLDATRHAECIERIGRLDARVGLALAQKRQELSATMCHRRRGRAGLHAYRRTLS